MKRPKIKIKKGDRVVVLRGAGKLAKKGEEGKTKYITGKVIKVDYKRMVVYVEGVNMIKKHLKPRRRGEKGKIVEVEGPIHISNVMLADPVTGEPTRIKIQRNDDGTFIRISKKSGQPIP